MRLSRNVGAVSFLHTAISRATRYDLVHLLMGGVSISESLDAYMGNIIGVFNAALGAEPPIVARDVVGLMKNGNGCCKRCARRLNPLVGDGTIELRPVLARSDTSIRPTHFSRPVAGKGSTHNLEIMHAACAQIADPEAAACQGEDMWESQPAAQHDYEKEGNDDPDADDLIVFSDGCWTFAGDENEYTNDGTSQPSRLCEETNA